MSFIHFIQTNKEILMSFLFLAVSIIAGFLSTTINRKTKIVGSIILALLGLGIATCLYYDSWQHLILSILLILAILTIPFIPIIFKNGTVSRKKIGKILYETTKKADRNKDICMFCGDMDFLGDYITLSDANKKKYKHDIVKNKQYRQIKDSSFSIKVLCLKPNREDNVKDQTSRLRLGFLQHELGNNLEIRFFNSDVCSSDKDCPYNLKKSNCNHVCYCPDLLLRGRLFHLKAGSICVILVTSTESGKKYKIAEYKNDSQEGVLYENIWTIWWKNSQKDDTFLEKCLDQYKKYYLK